MVATKKRIRGADLFPIQGKCQDRISKCSVHPRANIKCLITTCDIHSAQRRPVKKKQQHINIVAGKNSRKTFIEPSKGQAIRQIHVHKLPSQRQCHNRSNDGNISEKGRNR
jgi:hypothetical protein